MLSEQFQRFLSDIPFLTKKQRIILDEALTQQDSSNTLEQVIKSGQEGFTITAITLV